MLYPTTASITYVITTIFFIAGMSQASQQDQAAMTDAPSQPYKAPLFNDDLPPGSVVPDAYVVYLAPGHSIEAHKAVVGHEINVDIVLDRLYPDKLVYGAHMSREVLEAVRSDRGVEMVECDGKPEPC